MTFNFVKARRCGLILCLTMVASNLLAATHFVSLNSTTPAFPYLTWSTAATNIQDAIVASGNGETVLVTNGIYQSGVTFLAGSNRITISNNVTVQSVNGPEVTIIKGLQVPVTTNGATAIRCVGMLTSGTLSGFTLTNGATIASANSSGGGVYCNSTNCLVTNCVMVGNVSGNFGGGGSGGKYLNCKFLNNSAGVSAASIGSGGGVSGPGVASSCFVINCVLAGNYSAGQGGAAGFATLINCTVVSNVTAAGAIGSLQGCIVKNSILYYNLILPTNADVNVSGSYSNFFTNCCVSPSVANSGPNNFTNAPGFVDLAGGDLHLQTGSMCINAGNDSLLTNSFDLDGNPRVTGGTVDVGAYENQYTNLLHYVSLTSTNPVAPYTNWTTAATNLQDAANAAQPGEIVVAANGVYNFGKTVIFGQQTNRIALTNGITLLALYGPHATAIAATSNMRCAYVGSNSILSGFTLASGSTRSTGDIIKEQSGAGAWCEPGGVISNCVFGGSEFPYANGGNPVDSCTSIFSGGGVYGGTIYNSAFTGNFSTYGGAAASATLYNCVLATNHSWSDGGGAYQCALYNCAIYGNIGNNGAGAYGGTLYNSTVVSNHASATGGLANGTAYNSILYFNTGSATSNYFSSTLSYCDASPLSPGPGNFTNDPKLVNLPASDLHLASNSPCINAGNNSLTSNATDLDGNPRFAGVTVDVGAFEFSSPASIVSYAWLQQNGLPTDGSADYTDFDNDGMNNWQEWRVGTDPKNAQSNLQVLGAATSASGVTVTWSSSTNRTYFLQRQGALGLGSPFQVVATNIVGQVGTTSYLDQSANGVGPYFYRVGVP